MSGILVGIDGSHNASHALEWAMKEAALRNAPLTVLTVNQVTASYWTGNPVTVPADDERIVQVRKLAEEAVASTAAKLGSEQPPSVTVSAVHGFPAKSLIDASGDYDLLVVGSRGSGGFGSLVLGSVSNQVVHHAKCAVAVVPYGN
jgi:nucleotide-binding universal stress UspA family protein